MHFCSGTAPVLGILLAFSSSGCGTLVGVIEKTSDLLGVKAQEMRVAQARIDHAITRRREAARNQDCECDPHQPVRPGCLHGEGTINETLETELNFLVENGLELGGMQLDFNRISELAKEQARYDAAYDEAMKAWHEMEDEKYKAHLDELKQRATSPDGGSSIAGACDCIPIPDCAQPPVKEYVKSPPPKQQAVGLNEIPIMIRASARMNVGGMQYGRSQVRREYVPPKQPCCPECGVAGCDDRCDACGYIAPSRVNSAGNLPRVPPAEFAPTEPVIAAPPEFLIPLFSNAGSTAGAAGGPFTTN